MPGPLNILRALREAAMKKGLQEQPWFHGTRAWKPEQPLQLTTGKALWLADDPAMAARYTGGGRRAGPGQRAKAPVIYPFFARKAPHDVSKQLVTESVDENADDWLIAMGLDPTELRRSIEPKAQRAAEEFIARQAIGDAYEPTWNSLGSSGARHKYFSRAADAAANSPTRLWSVLDRPLFKDAVIEQLGPDAAFVFKHPTPLVEYTEKGRLRASNTPVVDRNVLWTPDQAAALVSPFGMRRGGLVSLRR